MPNNSDSISPDINELQYLLYVRKMATEKRKGTKN